MMCSMDKMAAIGSRYQTIYPVIVREIYPVIISSTTDSPAVPAEALSGQSCPTDAACRRMKPGRKGKGKGGKGEEIRERR